MLRQLCTLYSLLMSIADDEIEELLSLQNAIFLLENTNVLAMNSSITARAISIKSSGVNFFVPMVLFGVALVRDGHFDDILTGKTFSLPEFRTGW